LAAERVNFIGLITVLGNLSAADAKYSASLLDFRLGSTVYYVSISQPSLGTTTTYSTNETLTVLGDVVAITQNSLPIEPFPPATVSLNIVSNNFVVLSTTISSPTPYNDTLLASWNLSSVQPGNYYVSLSFGPGQAVSSRNITITGFTTSSTASSTANTETTTQGQMGCSHSTLAASSTLIIAITLSLMYGVL